MTRPRIFIRSLIGMAVLGVALALSHRASAAISEGPKYTNAVVAEQQRILQFYQAEQSFQEKLKVGRERYNQKQVSRGKIIAAMSAELQARQQTVMNQAEAVSHDVAEAPISGSGPWLALAVVAVGFLGFRYYLNRQNA